MSHRYLPAFCLLLVGCGGDSSPTVSLKGNVTVDGAPVERGSISFAPQNHGQDVSAPIIAGKYEVLAPKGKVKVFLQGTRETGKMTEQFGKEVPETVSVIPDHYAAGIDFDTTTGSADFALITDPPR